MPYEVGHQLGAVWDSRKANIRLTGNLRRQAAMPLVVMAKVANFSPVRLAFAWVKTANVPLILGQTNFFIQFDVCFYRSKLEFEINPMSYTLEDYRKESARASLSLLTPEERADTLSLFPAEERLAGLGVEERLAGLSAKDRQWLAKLLLKEQTGG